MVMIEQPTAVRATPSAARPVRADAPSEPKADRFSGSIQGLRAIAVGSVVLYHFWPNTLRGGYVGVDVFFVISGFLITAHLLRELETTGRIGLTRFWGRRVRRLLPASMTVLVACAAFVLLVMPAVSWAQNLREIRAASLYFENWQLAADAIDYLGAANTPSLVQHFWSLSVEEQFYLVEPVLLLVVFALTRSRRAIVSVLAAVVVVSGAYSVFLTITQPGVAYFSTGTRAWEFAAGGLVAAVPLLGPVRPAVRAALAWAGLAMIAAAVLLYDHTTPFPGWTAALPVAGAALVMATGDRSTPWGPHGLLRLPPMQRVGDWSYSIYLWHWPLLVAVPVVLGHELGWKTKLVVLAVVVLLAALTKRLIEDRFRRLPARRPLLRTYAPMIAAVAVFAVVTTGGISVQAKAVEEQAAQAARALAAGPQRCVGIGAVVNDCAQPYAVTETTVPAVAADDVPWNRGIAASTPCPGQSNLVAPVAHACTFNDPAAPKLRVVLVGDSHADHLIDPLNAAAAARDWRFTTYTREGCSGIPSSAEPDAKCRAWSTAVQDRLVAADDVDVVVFSNYSSAEAWTTADGTAAFGRLTAAGKRVVALEDVPGMSKGVNAPKCVAAHLAEDDPCTTPLPGPSKTAAAATAAGVPSVTVNDLLCRGGRCHTVIGGLIVYMDEAHLTLNFAWSLRDVYGSRIAAALGGADGSRAAS